VTDPGRRVAAIIEYDGTDYAGWQSAKRTRSRFKTPCRPALSFVAGHPIVAILRRAHRNAGVHAGRQGRATRYPRQAHAAGVGPGANTKLAPSIALQWAGEVSMGFHARHKAVRRIYRYAILESQRALGIASHARAWIHRPLDEAAMQAAAQALIGEH